MKRVEFYCLRTYKEQRNMELRYNGNDNDPEDSSCTRRA